MGADKLFAFQGTLSEKKLVRRRKLKGGMPKRSFLFSLSLLKI